MTKKKNKNQKVVSINRESRNFKFAFEKKILLDLVICLIVVLALFIPSLGRPWLMYDERIISEGIYFPTPAGIGEIFEIISEFGFNFNTLSSNTIYSSNYITRTCPLGQILGMLLAFFFNRNPFYYHLFILVLHLINTCLVFFILKVLSKSIENKPTEFIYRSLVIILTLIWAIHPVMVEPVLLSTNFGAGFSYMFFFSFVLDFLINRKMNHQSYIRTLLIPILFLIPMLTNEYIVTLPLVLFIISFYFTYQGHSLTKALKLSFLETKPYLIGFVLYVIYFLFISSYKISHPYSGNELILLIQRIFWLAPQIFIHFLKLVFYPKNLSIDQTLFVKLGKSLSDPYSVLCTTFLFLWLFIPLLFFLIKKKLGNLFLLSWGFFFALLPFLHILMPSYTMANERYLYCSLAVLIFGIIKIISENLSQKIIPILLSFLSIVLVLCFIRSYFRTLDWKDDFSFINSTYKTSTDPLFKAMRLGMFGKVLSLKAPHEKEEIRKYFVKTLSLLKQAKKELLRSKLEYGSNLPEIIKAYGLDYDSLLTKVAFLEASSRCLELNEDHKIGLKILEPYLTDFEKADPRVLELYTHLLILDKQYNKAKMVLLKANSIYPNTPFITQALVNLYTTYKKDKKNAEKYLLESLKANPYDPGLLLKALVFYQNADDPSITAKYAYLYGLRTQSKATYRQALSLYLNAEDYQMAEKVISKLLKLDSNNPETLYFISKYYYKTKNYNKALSILTDAYILTRQKASDKRLTFDITITLAKLYLFLGDKEKAISFMQEILSLAGDDPESLAKSFKLYKSLGLKEY